MSKIANVARWYREWRAIPALLYLLYAQPVWAAVNASSDVHVVDVGASNNFKYIGSTSTDGKLIFVCVQSKSGKYGFWSPADNAVHFESVSNCEKKSIVKARNLNWVNDAVQGTDEADTSASYADGSKIFEQFDLIDGICGFDKNNYYQVTFSNGEEYDFYVVNKLATPDVIDLACDTHANPRYEAPDPGFGTAKLLYGVFGGFSSIDVGSGRALLHVPYESYVPKIGGYRFARKLFIVDKSVVKYFEKIGTIYFIPKTLVDNLAGNYDQLDPIGKTSRGIYALQQAITNYTKKSE